MTISETYVGNSWAHYYVSIIWSISSFFYYCLQDHEACMFHLLDFVRNSINFLLNNNTSHTWKLNSTKYSQNSSMPYQIHRFLGFHSIIGGHYAEMSLKPELVETFNWKVATQSQSFFQFQLQLSRNTP